MSARYPLLGSDTAWRRFELNRGNSHSLFDLQLRGLERAALALNLTPESVHLASELAALDPSLKADERLALVVLILISLAALREGSTRFPVIDMFGGGAMWRMLDALWASGIGGEVARKRDGFAGEFGLDPREMAVTIDALLQSGRASAVIGSRPDEYKPLLFIAPYIYHQRVYLAEKNLAIRLARMLSQPASKQIESAQLSSALAEVFARPVVLMGKAIVLSEEQRLAVAKVAEQGLTIISGGPGTGKTSIVVAIMRLMVRLGIDPADIALAAPTGKAAYRMGEFVREALSDGGTLDGVDRALADSHPEPTTLHRLLGYSTEAGRFRHHQNNPLSARVVIVDEGSMLDLTLMERLTGAIAPGARLVVLGDADQLPSVAAGCVFRDLAPREGNSAAGISGASIRLAVNHRMRDDDPAGRAILQAARLVNDGKSDLLSTRDEAGTPIVTRRSAFAELSFTGVEFIAHQADDLTSFLDLWHERQLSGGQEIADLIKRSYLLPDDGFDAGDCARLRRLFEHFGRARILCVTRVFETGAERINARLHSRVAQTAHVAAERIGYIVGEPLLVVRNDYDRGLFNGDNGLCLWVRRSGGAPAAMAVFPRGDNFLAFALEPMRDLLELSYAMTVHKAQGSEFDTAAIVLPEEALPMLTRELFYTAVSRSRKSVVILGAEDRVREAIANRVARFSGLPERIRQALSNSQ